MALLEVRNLRVLFETVRGTTVAVDDVSLRLNPGETLGLVGESGSGKSVTAQAILGLVPTPPGRVETGEVLLAGRNLMTLSPTELRGVRGREVAMIFQDPQSALNPLMTIGRQMGEVLEVHRGLRRREARSRCARALDEVGVPDAERQLDAYPHQLSGGMRQRVLIATALLCEPRVLIADEPTTALDPTIQAQVLALLAELQERHGTAILLITHDLSVVANHCDRVHVLYAGRTVETAQASELLRLPLHPYTLGLLRSVPRLEHDPERPLETIPGHPPDLRELPEGCAFAPRCEFATLQCQRDRPPLAIWQDPTNEFPSVIGRRAACFEHEQVVADQTEIWALPDESLPELEP